MDYPVSVPGVGLVGGKFVDENPGTGQPGSLMASAWGNAVTEELLSIIRAAGLVPDEAKTNQVLEAIRALVPERSEFDRRTGTNSLPASAFGIYALDDGGAAATVTLPSVAVLASDTELLLFAGSSNIAGIQVKAVAGETIQGHAALMPASTTAFMLTAPGDWARLRSEKAHGRWVVVASCAVKRLDLLDERISVVDAKTDFAIVYPNGGSAAAPAYVSVNTSYVSANPFPGYHVICEAQVLYGGVWSATGWYTNNTGAIGVAAHQKSNEIVTVVGQTGTIPRATIGGNAFGNAGADVLTPVQSRVLCHKVKGQF